MPSNDGSDGPDIENTDWESLMEFADVEPHEPIERSTLEVGLFLHTENANQHHGPKLLVQAKEDGVVEYVEGGYIRSENKKLYEEKKSKNREEKVQGEFSGENQPGNSERTDGGVSAATSPRDSFPQKTEPGRIEQLESRMDALSRKFEDLHEQTYLLEDALRETLGVEESVSQSRLIQIARERNSRFEGLEERSKTNELRLNEVSKPESSNSMSKEQRITAIRKELVRKNTGSRKRGMDYNAIDSFLQALGAGVSSSYNNQLVDLAATGHDAFYVKRFEGSRPKQLRVHMSKIPADSIYRGSSSE